MSSAAPLPLPPRPPPTAPRVLSAIETLSPHLRLPSLLTHLRTLSATLSLAQTRTAAFHDIHNALQRLSLTTLRLADRTVSTLAAFRHAAHASLDNLDLAADLLRDDLPAVAHSLLSAEAAAAARLARQSHALALDFDAAAADLTDAVATAFNTRLRQEAAHADLAQAVAHQWFGLHRAQATHDAAQLALQEADRLYVAAEAREASARLKISIANAAKFAAMVGTIASTSTRAISMLGASGATALAAQYDKQILQAREERAVHLKHRQDARKERLDGAREVSELRERLRAVREEKTIAQDAMDALEEALHAIRALGGVMLRAETFWKSITEHMEAGGMDSVLGIVQTGSKLGEEERKALWMSSSLKTTTEAVQAQWVALQSICDDCIAGLGEAREDMSLNVTEGEDTSVRKLKKRGLSLKELEMGLETASPRDSCDTELKESESLSSEDADEAQTLLKPEKESDIFDAED